MTKAVAIASLIFLAGCGSAPPKQLSALTDEFVHTTLSFSPATATATGLHQYQKQNLDELLDDFSPANLARQKRFYEGFQQRLNLLRADQLSAEEQADIAMLQDQTSLALLDLNTIHSAQHNPTIYVETLGNALFNPFVLEYAPLRNRLQSIISRLQKVPLFLDQASGNLDAAPLIWTQVAIEENEGNIGLVDKAIRAAVPDDLRDSYSKAATGALAAMQKFQTYLKSNLSNRTQADWRLGHDAYTLKFRYALESGMEPDTTLQLAETELGKVRSRMLDLALPLHQKIAPKHADHADLEGDKRQNQVIGEVLDEIARKHSTRESYMDDAKHDLEEARAFVAAKHLLTLPSRSNLQVIPTPEFMRGIYSVGGFNAAPALEPQLGAFYWVTPIPADWPAERVESKLREYNFYKLKLLTIHEAMPGHYVQMEFANDVQPDTRRVLRSVYGSGPYVEGWGQYATQIMLDEGFLDHSPELALTFAKEELRVIANTILDVRLQMLNMTDQEAMDLMQQQTFQEQEEARGKLQRAKLSSCQLPMYFVGWRGWLRVRETYKQGKGAAWKLAEFNDNALKEGAVPLPLLNRLLAR
ncbi:MAG TPA: DUF885 domain-containing protein [Bryobacteraceae bacterium]|nr:DUF885 domain-containing protein [Bryobacteraceae bacterium]